MYAEVFGSLVLAFLIIKLYRHFTFWQSQGISCRPFLNFQFPFMPPHQFFLEHNAKYGPIYGGYDINRKFLTLNDARLVRGITTKQFMDFTVRSSLYLGSSNVKKGLFWMDASEDWKRVRSFITPAFTSGKLKRMMSPIGRISDNFIEHLREHAKTGDEFDIKRYIGGFVMDVITECAYGIKIDSIKDPQHPVVVHARMVLNTDMPASFTWCYLFPETSQKLDLQPFDMRAVHFFRKLTNDIIEQRLRMLKENSGNAKKASDLFGMMLENLVEESELQSGKLSGLTRAEIFGQGMTFIIGGFDSTHATFDHMMYFLAQHTEWQDRLYDELVEAEVKEKGFDYETLKGLPVLNAVINETLRLTPAITSFNRESNKDCVLLDTGIRIPKRTVITIQPVVIHRNPEYFPDPLKYNPQRFLDDPNLDSHFAFMPFGSGHRLCIGMRFAMNELRLGISNFILNYRVFPGPNLKMEYYKASVIFSPKVLMVKISER